MDKIKNYLFFAGFIFINPKLLYLAFIKKVYLPVFIQLEWLKKYDINTVIDIGAYHGEVSKALLEIFPKAKVYAFEPVSENYKYILNNLKSKNLKLFNIAISNKKSKIPFYIYKKTYLSSSKLLSKKYSKKHFSKKAKRILVESNTLDNIFEGLSLKSKILLKIDTQGQEYEILSKATGLLKKVDIIHIETSFEKIYEKQKLFNDIYELLIKQSFVFIGENKESYFYPTFEPDTSINSVFVKTT